MNKEFNPLDIDDLDLEGLDQDLDPRQDEDPQGGEDENNDENPQSGGEDENDDEDNNPPAGGEDENDDEDNNPPAGGGEDNEDDSDFIELLIENPKEAVKKILETDRSLLREVVLEELNAIQQQAMEEQQKYNEFLEQKEELKKTYAPDYDEVVNDKVIEDILKNPELAAEIYNSPNIAEKAYYYAKFGTTNPTLKQIESLVRPKSKDVPPVSSGRGGFVDDDDDNYLDPDSVDL